MHTSMQRLTRRNSAYVCTNHVGRRSGRGCVRARSDGAANAAAAPLPRAAAAAAAAPNTPQQPQPKQQQQRKQQRRSKTSAADADHEHQQQHVLASLEPWLARELLPSLLEQPPSTARQPSNFLLPLPSAATFEADVAALQAAARQLPNSIIVVAAGAAVAAAGAASTGPLPLLVAHVVGSSSSSGGGETNAWARWAREWAAGRMRHAQPLADWLCLSGRADAAALERTAQSLVGGSSGGGGSGGGKPYELLICAALQERLSASLHANAGRLAAFHGAPQLGAALSAAAAESAAHAGALSAAVTALFAADAAAALRALRAVAAAGPPLPGQAMDDGWHRGSGGGGGSGGNSSGVTAASAAAAVTGIPAVTPLFSDFVAAADAAGALTVDDRAAAFEEALRAWNVAELASRNDDGGRTADDAALLLRLPGDLRRLGELQADARLSRGGGGGRGARGGRAAGGAGTKDAVAAAAAFSWVFGREVPLVV